MSLTRCCLLLAVSLSVLAPGLAGAAPPLVILLSWDGVRHDYPSRGELPGLDRMKREGTKARRMNAVFPPNTFPAHVSMATGATVARHGIVDNRFYDTERGLYEMEADASWVAAEPLWITAERQGLRAATFFWVASESDWNGQRSTYRRAPFDAGVGEAEKVEQILEWVALPESERPSLIMSWWHGADGVGHRKGPNHPDVFPALAEQDEHLQRLIAGIDARDGWAYTTLVIVSDHGMAEVSESIDVSETLETADISARVFPGSSIAHVFLDDATEAGRAQTVLAALPGVTAHLRDALPASLRYAHPNRTGDVVLLTDPPRTFRVPGFVQSLFMGVGGWFGWRPALHGYTPTLEDMGTIFYAMGRGVPPDLELDVVNSIDVAPTAAALLGIDPPRDAEGRAIPGIGDGS